MIDADTIRDIITGQDQARPRSRQKRIGPSDLSSPCSRRLMYQLLDVPRHGGDTVNLSAWVGTAMHASLEQALARNNDWLTEVPISIEVSDEVKLTGHADAFHLPTGTVVDYKSVGPSALDKYRVSSPEKYLMQISVYGLGLTLAGHTVNHTALAYIPRNGALSDIHVDTRPWDQGLAEGAIRRYEQLLVAATAGPAAIPLTPTAADCRFCPWWVPGWPGSAEEACSGHLETTGTDAAGPNPTQPERNIA